MPSPREIFDALPRTQLTFPGPSHIHKLERLTAKLGGAAIYAKREDLNSPLAGGGNKVSSGASCRSSDLEADVERTPFAHRSRR
jgi:hypothetical protein